MDIDKIESVQRSFTKRLSEMCNKTYPERLSMCHLVSLELRRLHLDLILCFKIVHNMICLKLTDFFIFEKNSVTRGHNLKLRYPISKTTCQQKSFAVRVIPVWNSLSSELVNCSSLKAFKLGIRKINFSKFLINNFDSFPWVLWKLWTVLKIMNVFVYTYLHIYVFTYLRICILYVWRYFPLLWKELTKCF